LSILIQFTQKSKSPDAKGRGCQLEATDMQAEIDNLRLGQIGRPMALMGVDGIGAIVVVTIGEFVARAGLILAREREDRLRPLQVLGGFLFDRYMIQSFKIKA